MSLLPFVAFLGALCMIGWAVAVDAVANNVSTPSSEPNRQICSVQNGLEVLRVVSSATIGVFRTALQDVELMRELASESMDNGGVEWGFATLEDLAATLDWQARGLNSSMTTLDAGLGYTDDRPDRRIDRYVSLLNEPLVGTKETDMAICETLAGILPWILDRQSREDHWWLDHQNGQSEGQFKHTKVVDQLYTGAW